MLALALAGLFITGFVILWMYEDKVTEKIKNVINQPSFSLIFERFETVQDHIFVDENYCNTVKRIQDCDPEELNQQILLGYYVKKAVDVGWVAEEFLNCSGMGDAPIRKYLFTGW